MDHLIHLGVFCTILLLVVLSYKYVLRLFGVWIIPDDKAGVVIKNWKLLGKNKRLATGKIIALNGEAGIQADTLAPGAAYGYWPWQYTVKQVNLTTVPKGQIGIVQAKDGEPISGGRNLARTVECSSYQDARAFLLNKGQRGPQMAIIPPGTYRINTELFTVTPVPVTEIKDNMVGIVTTKDGIPLKTGNIAGPEVQGHNMFQDGESFITNGGYKGLQEQVLLAGIYFLNPGFAAVDPQPMTVVPIATAGVVIAYVGEEGTDQTGADFKHGNLVSKGHKGVWIEPLDPGKYAINKYTHSVETVPTANVVLNWATGKSEAHELDKNLSTITVRSGDGFKYNLDVSQIIHIPRSDAPKVIARFGSMSNLVTQVLEPTIGNYFRNAAQKSDVIDFLRNRTERQDEARTSISAALNEYNVGAVDTLIGDIVPPEELMKTLTDRKVAEQQKETFKTQQLAEEARKEREQATAMANTQSRVVDSERKVQIAQFDANAEIEKSKGDAQAKTINATADAQVITLNGNATAERTLAIGNAEAKVIELKTAALTSDNYAMIEVARSLSEHNMKIVPDIISGGNGHGSNLADAFIAKLMLSQDRQAVDTTVTK